MKTYVLNGVPSRRAGCETHLNERGVQNLIWIDMFPSDCLFVRWVKKSTDTPLDTNLVSWYLKFLFALADGCDQDYIMIIEDDVVFCKNWKEKILDLKLEHINLLGIGVCYSLRPEDPITFTKNPGGIECTIFSREACNYLVGNINFGICMDIMVGAVMLHEFRLDIYRTPICHQTSLLESKSSHVNSGDLGWIDTVTRYKPTGNTWSTLITEFNKFKVLKGQVDRELEETYGVTIDSQNIDFITQRSRRSD